MPKVSSFPKAASSVQGPQEFPFVPEGTREVLEKTVARQSLEIWTKRPQSVRSWNRKDGAGMVNASSR